MVEERRSKKGARLEGGRGRAGLLGARPFLMLYIRILPWVGAIAASSRRPVTVVEMLGRR